MIIYDKKIIRKNNKRDITQSQPPYGMPPPPAPGKFPLGAFVPAGSLSISTPTTYGALPMLSHMPPYVGRPPSQLVSY